MSEVAKKRGRKPKEVKEFSIPTESDRIKVVEKIKQASASLTMIQGQKDHIKTIAADLKEEYGMPLKKFNKQLRMYHNQNAKSVVQESIEDKEDYENLFKINIEVDV